MRLYRGLILGKKVGRDVVLLGEDVLSFARGLHDLVKQFCLRFAEHGYLLFDQWASVVLL